MSIVISVYNEEKYIKECLESVFGQTEKPNEVIIIDNNCTDKTIAIAKQYDIRVITEKQQGMIPARNAGFTAANGDIIVKLDADSRLRPDAITRIVESFKKNQNIVAVTGPIVFYNLSLLSNSRLPSLFVILIWRAILGKNYLFGPCYAITRSIWAQVRSQVCTDESVVHEDLDMAHHVGQYGKIAVLKEVLVAVSPRRILSNPYSFFVEYTLRLFKMRTHHNK